MKSRFFLIMAFAVFLGARTDAGDRRVLIEIFTNSHCSLCPPAHASINAYVNSGTNADKVTIIAYHTLFPYSTDPLAQANSTQPAARYSYYGSSSSTPITYFDGVDQGRSYSSWAATLDNLAAASSPLDITVSGTRNGSTLSVRADLQRTASIAENDLVLHSVVVEDVAYVGGNGVANHDIMRTFMTPVAGTSVSFDANGSASITESVTVTNVADLSATRIVVFVQSLSTKKVYQSAILEYATLTSAEQESAAIPSGLSLAHAYPNPFNPGTMLTYSIAESEDVTLTVVDVLGRVVAILVDRKQQPGTYQVRWNADGLPGGVYFAVLRAGEASVVRRAVLLK